MLSPQVHRRCSSFDRTTLHPRGYCPDDDDCVVHSFLVFTYYENSFKDDKYFTLLLVSVSPEKTVMVLMQVDSATMRINTLLFKDIELHSPVAILCKDHPLLWKSHPSHRQN